MFMFFVEATERISMQFGVRVLRKELSGEFNFALYLSLTRDNSVGIATGYGLDGCS